MLGRVLRSTSRPAWFLLGVGALVVGFVSPAVAEHNASVTGGPGSVVESDATAGLDYVGKLIVGPQTGRYSFGYAVAVDGDTIVAGAPRAMGDQGKAYILYDFAGTGSFSAHTLNCEHNAQTFPDGNCGRSVAVDGRVVAIGIPHWPSDQGLDDRGAVWTAQLSGGSWEAWPLIEGAVLAGYFGESVALDGRTLAVGAPLEDVNSSASSVDIFRPTDDPAQGHWERLDELEPGRGADPNYGWNVAFQDGTLAVGATGGAYVFRGNPGSFGQPQELIYGEYGQIDVALDGDWLVVGNHDEGGSPPGAVHVYKWNGTKYVEKQVLTPPDSDHELFGWSVAIQGDTILVGDPRDHGRAAYSGAVHVYRHNGTTWKFTTTMKAPDLAAEDQFGWDVAISADWMVIGAPWNDEGGTDSGAIYVYTHDITLPPPVAKCDGLKATIVGTSGNDELKGTPGFDIIAGLGGHDVIAGLGGGDLLCGGPGNDLILGGPGLDRMFGGAGNDVLEGNGGDDQMFGGPGADRIVGKAGADIAKGNGGNDRLEGNGGSDSLYGGPGRDVMTGGPGDDFLYGGRGVDTARYVGAGAAVMADLAIGIVSGGAGFDILTAVNNIIGSGFGDELVGNANPNVIKGGAGHDSILGKAGNDTLWGGPGIDSIFGGPGKDKCVGEQETSCES